MNTVSRLSEEAAAYLALESIVDITKLSTTAIGSGDQTLEISLEQIKRRGDEPAVSVLFEAPRYSGGGAEIHPSEIPHLITALTDLYRTWQNQNHAEDN
ncbi:hypothetical protein P3H15_33270 [Rhodococcus sp. T2V]|uniref:hypothetical protein n=1 Tax=Rhodococcus sp. T2V TaxID=3034164 RepID=UPI0023E24DA7|nr:hypothetical protein [Rhodococcus sp. T2V]MDF3309891.1 hypothetical protein [Rhodococcus sp. T2V]